MASSDRSLQRATQPKRRAAGACHSCHARKVRCSLSHTGHPCLNCSLDQLECEPRANKKRKTGPQEASVPQLFVPHAPIAARRNACRPSVEAVTLPAVVSSHRGGSEANPTTTSEASQGKDTPYRPLAEHFSHYADPGESDQLSTAREDALEDQYALIYGDPQGVSLVAEICEPQQRDKSGHLFVPRIQPLNVDQSTLDYLRIRGVFDLPERKVCEMLIRAYFHHVHPFYPVVQADIFLETFAKSPHDLSCHLLWSMFLAAANFADSTTLEDAGFISRKEMKRSMYIKAKALYDAEYEKHKITLIQAVLLMGFWYADTEDRTGPWHWNGVAISLCQTIGLHRNPDNSSSQVKSMQNQRLWRDLWWSCFYREVWFSVGMGRPMRIHLADCDTPLPRADVSEECLANQDINARERYLPEPDDLQEVSKMWTQLLNVTVVLSEILLQQQRRDQSIINATRFEQIERRIRACSEQFLETGMHSRSRTTASFAYHLMLYIESVVLTLYRPCILPSSTKSVPAAWQNVVEQKTRSAAAATNQILSGMISADMVNTCQSIICIALVPTLQIHLLDYTSPKSMVHRMGKQHLELCMIVVEELKITYFGAEILYRMFTKAQKQIHDRKHSPRSELHTSHQNETPVSGSSIANNDAIRDTNVDFSSLGNEFDALSAIWSSGDLMTSYDFLEDSE